MGIGAVPLFRRTVKNNRLHALVLAGILSLPLSQPAVGLDSLVTVFATPDNKLKRALAAASLVVQGRPDTASDPLEIFTAARSDYARLLSALYAEGYYAAQVHIFLDGREASEIPATDAPTTISAVRIEVDPGQRFRFGKARMRPYAPGTRLPPAYRDTKIAYSTAIVDAAEAGIVGWRKLGYAKASVSAQSIVADHRTGTVDSEIMLDAGPKLRFGTLHIIGRDRMTEQRISRIAGYRPGKDFDPALLDKMVDRLRQTGVFRTVSVAEAADPGPDGTLDITLNLEEEPLHRFGFGAQISSADGADLSAFWLHRNLFGGGERLRFDGAILGIGNSGDVVGLDFGARIDRPATPAADSTAFVAANIKRLELFDLEFRDYSLGFGLSRVLSDALTVDVGLTYAAQSLQDPTFQDKFAVLALPVSVTLDRRNDKLAPNKGSYLKFSVTPFNGFGTTDSGAQFKAEARAYRGFGPEKDLVLAGRFQLGTVVGTALLDTPPDYLFYSGGGGTVRGHPFRSLGVSVARSGTSSNLSGGLSFIGLSGEVRKTFTEKIGAVAFYDAGYISASSAFSGSWQWQAGAGLGLRYETGLGPVRLDLAVPVAGTTGDGLQVYVGIGQAF